MNIPHKLRKWLAERRRRATLADLRELDDHLLKDVGLCRADLFAARRKQ